MLPQKVQFRQEMEMFQTGKMAVTISPSLHCLRTAGISNWAESQLDCL